MSVEEEMHYATMEFSGKHHRQKLAKAMTILILLQSKQEEEEEQKYATLCGSRERVLTMNKQQFRTIAFRE